MQLLLPLFLAVAPPEQDYGQATAQLQTAVENSTGEDREAAIAALAEAIALQGQYPDEASANVSEPVLEARVILIRLYLAEKNLEAAQAATDDLIRTARGQAPPVRSYGREVTELYEKRTTALQAAGVATLEIDCKVACDMIVNERRSTTASEDLLLGAYRIWVKAAGSDASWEYHEVELVEPGTVTTVVYEDPNPPAVAENAPPPPPPPPPPQEKKRMLPRGAEITGALVGVGVAVVGAVLLTFDGKCSVSKEIATPDMTPEECGKVYNSIAGGASLIAVGGGLLLVSGVMLSVDEVRVGREKGRQVMVGVTLRF
jgi:hypothetical protein